MQPTMSQEELKRRVKQYLDGWKVVNEIQEQERFDRLPNVDTIEAIERLGDLFDSAVWLHPPNETSGMIEMRQILSRGRK